MPLGSTATYPGGTYRTEVNTSGYEGGGGPPGGGGRLEQALWDMAQRRADQQMRKAALEERRMALENRALEQRMKEEAKAARVARSSRGRMPAADSGIAAMMDPVAQQRQLDRARQESVRSWTNFGRGQQTAAQKAAGMVGGLTGQAYQDMMAQIGARQAALGGIGDYTGWTNLIQAALGSPASSEAVTQANKNLRHQQSLSVGAPPPSA